MSDIFSNKTFKITTALLIAAVIILSVYLFLNVLIILVISILLAFIFHPLVTFLEEKNINRLFSTLTIFAVFGLVFYLAISYLVPNLVLQVNALAESLKDFSLHEQIILLENEIAQFLPIFQPGEFSKKVESIISGFIYDSVGQITNVLSSIVSVIAVLVIVPFITFFILKDSKQIIKGLLNVMPNNLFEMSYWIIKKISLQLGRFVRGWIFDATFVGIMCGLGFYIIGINNALPLGIIAGVGHLIPYFGPAIAAIPAVIISIIQFGDLSHIPYIIIMILSVYTIDNGFVQPYVFSKSVDMHPIIIILLIILGSQVFGILGMLLAVPVTSVVRTAVKEMYFAFKNYKIARL